MQRAIRKRYKSATPGLAPLIEDIERSKFAFPQNATDVVGAALAKTGAGYPDLMRDLFKYLPNLEERGAKPNREAQLVGRFSKVHAAAQVGFKKSGAYVDECRITCVFPPGGIHDNNVNRLLLMSSSEQHLSNVPMAFFIEPAAQLIVGAEGRYHDHGRSRSGISSAARSMTSIGRWMSPNSVAVELDPGC